MPFRILTLLETFSYLATEKPDILKLLIKVCEPELIQILLKTASKSK